MSEKKQALTKLRQQFGIAWGEEEQDQIFHSIKRLDEDYCQKRRNKDGYPKRRNEKPILINGNSNRADRRKSAKQAKLKRPDRYSHRRK